MEGGIACPSSGRRSPAWSSVLTHPLSSSPSQDAIAGVVANIVFGRFVDNGAVSLRALLSASQAMLCVAAAIGVLLEAGALKSSARDGLAVCFGLVYGGGSTAFYLFLKTATAKLFGRRHVGAIMGFINLALFCGIALGGVLYAVTRTSSGTYRPALRTSCAVSACRAAAVLWLRLSPYHVLTRASLQWPPRPLPRGRASARRRRRRPKTGRRRSRKSRCEEAPT